MEKTENVTLLGFYLNRAFGMIVGMLEKSLKRSGIPLNHAQFAVLRQFDVSGKTIMSQTEIAKALGKDRAAISRTVCYLEKQGYISRVPVNGCKNGVSLALKGIELRSKLEEIIREVTFDACSGQSEEDIKAGIKFLFTMITK